MPFAEKSPTMCLDERGVCNAAGKTFSKGLKDGIPICLGYLSVSFTFGMMAAKGGLPLWAIQLISMTNLTSAGQFAGLDLILSGGLYVELAVTTFVINVRYLLMSLSLSQKIDPAMSSLERLLLSFGVTDEIFAVAVQQKEPVNARYLTGLISMPYVGWALGTLLGATAAGILPLPIRSALGIAIYGMFLAIIIPPAVKTKPVAVVAVIAVVLSCLFKWVPGRNQLSSGWVVILCAIPAAAFAALRWPVEEETEEAS